MESKEIINQVLAYVDSHLQETISVGQLARQAGYSEYHFLRLFKSCMNMTVMEYVNRRRLIKASEDILDGTKILDAAVSYGWQSHSGFTKAFKREFGFSPSLLKVMAYELNKLVGSAMNHVFLQAPRENATKEELLEIWKTTLQENKIALRESEVDQIYQCACCSYEGLTRYSGDEYVTHPLHVAIVLTELNAEPEVICAGMFCDVAKKGRIPLEQLKEKLPSEVWNLVKETSAWELKNASAESSATLIKLAERLHNMRTVEYMEAEKQQEKARETIEFFLPLARRLENSKLMDELNDLSLKYYVGSTTGRIHHRN